MAFHRNAHDVQEIYNEIIGLIADDLRHEYSGKELKSMHEEELDEKIHDELYVQLKRATLYTEDCIRIVVHSEYDPFQNHEINGSHKNWEQAGWSALWDIFHNDEYEWGWYLGDVRNKLGL